MRAAFALVIFLAFGFRGEPWAGGQTGGVITGQVTDKSGSALPSALVSLRNVATQTERVTTTDASGRYEFSQVSIGIYRVRIEKDGFSAAVRTLSLVVPGERIEANFELAPGAIAEEVTVAAARSERDILKIDARSETLPQEELLKQNIIGTGDALLSVPNISPVNSGPYLVRPRLRGLDSTRILVMIDGERLNTSRVATDRAGPELGLVDPSLIQSIEVIYGSGSVLYGTDALSGTINIITDMPRPIDQKLRIGGSLNLFYSTNEKGRRGTVRVDIAGRKFAVRASSGLERYSNYHSGKPFNESSLPLHTAGVIKQQVFGGVIHDPFNQPFTRTSSEIFNSQSHGSNLSLSARYFLGENQSLRLSLNRRRNGFIGFPDFIQPFFFQVINLPRSDLDKVNLHYENQGFTDWFTRLAVGAYWQAQDRILRNDFAVFGSTPPRPGDPPLDTISRVDILSNTRQNVKSFGYDVQTNFLFKTRNVLTTGVSYFRDHSRDSRVTITSVTIVGAVTRPPSPPRFFPLNVPIVRGAVSFPQRVPISNFQNVGLFLQDEHDMTRWLRLIGGLRIDRFDVDTRPTPGYDPLLPGILDATPKLDLSKLPNPKGEKLNRTTATGSFGIVVRPSPTVSLTARIGRSFRYPNLEELFFTGPATIGNIIANTKVEPEKGINLDLSVKVRTSRYIGSVTYFNNTYKDFISTEVVASSPTVGSGGLISQAINFARLRIQGIEADLEVPMSAGRTLFTWFGNLGYLRGQILEGENPLTKTSLKNTPADNITPFKSVLGVRWQDTSNRFWWEYSARIQTRVNRVSPLLSESPFLIAQDLFGLYGFTVHALRGGYNFQREPSRLSLTLAVENLGNKFYREQFQFAPARGRSLTIGLLLKNF
ncbi:MAG: TonB-dependent receptor [Thermofilaceae archaeon]